MIQTAIVFDYGTEEFLIRVFDRHIEPAAIRVDHRSGWSNGPTQAWTPLSDKRLEIRHEGIAGEDDIPTDEIDYDDLCVALDNVEYHRNRNVDEHIDALQEALDLALALVPGWMEPAVGT